MLKSAGFSQSPPVGEGWMSGEPAFPPICPALLAGQGQVWAPAGSGQHGSVLPWDLLL